nr:tyrosine-type recombinase/integrase [uncultured Niameybacter sp.]
MAKIPQRSDGRYYSRVNIGRTTDGKPKYKYIYGATQKEVKEKLRAFTTDLDTYGKPLSTSFITLSDWTYKHLFINVHHRVAASTFERYISIYNNHIKNSPLADMHIKDIHQIHIQNYLNEKKSLSKSSLKKIYELLNNSFKTAISNNLVRLNPMEGVALPTSKINTSEIEILTLTEQKSYTQALGNELYGILYLTTLLTGMRLGEIIALKWHNVNLNEATITVCESYKRVRKYNSNGTSFTTIDKKRPKTQKGTRTIPIPQALVTALKTYKLASPNSAENLVFCTSSGNCLSDSNIRKYHDRICKAANIRNVSFHALRHTFATRMIENNVDVKTVSEMLGHTTVELTLNRYVHSTHETKRIAADAMDKLHKELLL